MTKTLDFLEQDYNLRPTPIRALRDKHQFDYGNAQSPSKRLSTRTPRRSKESSSISENLFIDESPGQQFNAEALPRPQIDNFRSSKLVLVDALSWIISACVLIVISIAQLFTRFIQRSNDRVLESIPISQERSSFTTVTGLFTTFYDFMGIALADLSNTFRKPAAMVKSICTCIQGLGLSVYMSIKSFFDSQKIKYHLKNLVLSLGLGVLFIALVVNFRYSTRIDTQSKPAETDYELKFDADGCTSGGCLINPVLYKKIELIVNKNAESELKTLTDKLHILQMQVDIQQEFIDQQLHSLSSNIHTEMDESLNSRLQTLKHDLDLDISNLKTVLQPFVESNGPDFGLASGGASISSHSPSYYSSSSPYTLLEPSRNPGECWGMKGYSGFVEIELARKIIPELVVIRHAEKSQLYKDGYKSAPRDVEILHSDEILGRFVVDPELARGEKRLEVTQPVDKLMLRILSNWGNDDWTCIYKVEVFGREA